MTTMTAATPSLWRRAFLLALGVGVLIFLPFVLYDGGYFIYYGDFNVQQIPFYKLAHEAVRSGDIWWSWHTDLGANFIGSYSFYLLFSPFFWLTLPFPTTALPFLMAPLLVLKTACAALTGYLYLERFVRNRAWAVVGSLLYAFSGWMFFNIFFNHFHDVAVFFPLLLLGVEKLVCEDKKAMFAVIVAVCAMVNYWFFVGEAVFVALYVLVRICSGDWPMTGRKFTRLCVEAVMGVGLSAAVMLPSVLAILGNPRTGLEELLTGWSFWLYWHEQRQPAIIQSLFFPPELPARPNFLPDHGAKWSSLSGWLPMVGLTGVLAYFFQRKNDWLKKMLALSLVMALVPGLNSLFILLNNSYYARWFFMPLLLMALASIRALEDSVHTAEHFRRALTWSLVVVVVFAVMSGLTPNCQGDEPVLGLADDLPLMWAFTAVAVACLVLTALLVLYFRRSARFLALTCAGIMLVSSGFGIFYVANGKNNYERSQAVINTAIRGREYIQVTQEPFNRVDIYDGMDNLGMFWHLPNIQAFHSIVPPSVMDFYPTVGVKRDVGSRPETKFYALRSLLSVRWLFIEKSNEEQEPMPDYSFYGEQIGYNIYENQNYLPMGFAYDHYITRTQLEGVDEIHRGNMMLRALVLEDDEAWRQDDILERMQTESPMSFTLDDTREDVAGRRQQTADSFTRDNRGFTARSSLEGENILFFSVPWDEGWSATVNGEPTEVLRVNIGFIGIRVPAGAAEIRLDYTTPGLRLGICITGGFLLIWLIYFLRSRRKKKAPEKTPETDEEKIIAAAQARNLSWEEYRALYGDGKARATRLQRTINEAYHKGIPNRLPQEERTLAFDCGPEPETDGGEQPPPEP